MGLVNCFVTAKANSFENLLDPFLKTFRMSTSITIAMTKSSAFFKRIVDRLSHNSKAVVRLNLLRILRTVCEVHPNRAMLVERYGLLGLVEGLSQGGGDGAVLVRELAREIVPVLKPGLRPLTGKLNDSPKTVAPKKMRRTASDTSATLSSASGVGSGGSGSGSGGTARLGGGSRKSARDRAKLGDIPWFPDNDSGSGGRR